MEENLWNWNWDWRDAQSNSQAGALQTTYSPLMLAPSDTEGGREPSRQRGAKGRFRLVWSPSGVEPGEVRLLALAWGGTVRSWGVAAKPAPKTVITVDSERGPLIGYTVEMTCGRIHWCQNLVSKSKEAVRYSMVCCGNVLL